MVDPEVEGGVVVDGGDGGGEAGLYSAWGHVGSDQDPGSKIQSMSVR